MSDAQARMEWAKYAAETRQAKRNLAIAIATSGAFDPQTTTTSTTTTGTSTTKTCTVRGTGVYKKVTYW